MADFRAELRDHRLIRVRHEKHRVRHAGVQRVNGLRADREGNDFVEPQVLGGGEVHRHALAVEAGGDDARPGFEAKTRRQRRSVFARTARSNARRCRTFRRCCRRCCRSPTPSPPGRMRDGTSSITPSAPTPRCRSHKRTICSRFSADLAGPVVEQDEVVARAVHLGKFQNHERTVTRRK